MKKPTIMTVVGTRPEIIRLSRLIPKFDEEFNHVLIHTGQNYDPLLSDIFFEELRLRQPDEYLDVDHSSLGKTIGDLFIKFEVVLKKYNPDGVFILGDTNSSLVAILAKRMQIPVYHWEAGNRSFDENVPEETNRRIVDHTAHFNIVYSRVAQANLFSEGIQANRVLLSGSPMKEVLDFYREDIESSHILDKFSVRRNQFFTVSIHRQENVDESMRLTKILTALQKVSELWEMPVLISTHPRTSKKINQLENTKILEGLIFSEPLGFFDYVNLQKNSFCVISDSGSVSEESAILGFNAITIRDSMERQEALKAGTIVMTGIELENIIAGIEKVTTDSKNTAPEEYLVEYATDAVVSLVRDSVSRFEDWSGVLKLSRS